MQAIDSFYSVKERALGLYKEKGSSFISHIYPFLAENDLKPILLELKKEHSKARHICYAYRTGPDTHYQRVQDDGEPSGTAGKPILGQLIKYNLENTLITVVRYFGGTLLGASGLGLAYKAAAENAIAHAEIIQVFRKSYFEFDYNYGSEKFIESCLKKLDGEVRSKIYTGSIKATVAFPISTNEIIISSMYNFRLESKWDEEIKTTFLYKDSF